LKWRWNKSVSPEHRWPSKRWWARQSLTTMSRPEWDQHCLEGTCSQQGLYYLYFGPSLLWCQWCCCRRLWQVPLGTYVWRYPRRRSWPRFYTGRPTTMTCRHCPTWHFSVSFWLLVSDCHGPGNPFGIEYQCLHQNRRRWKEGLHGGDRHCELGVSGRLHRPRLCGCGHDLNFHWLRSNAVWARQSGASMVGERRSRRPEISEHRATWSLELQPLWRHQQMSKYETGRNSLLKGGSWLRSVNGCHLLVGTKHRSLALWKLYSCSLRSRSRAGSISSRIRPVKRWASL